MEHSTWLSFMRERLLLIRDLLAPDGSVWVHLDDAEQHRMRLLMDEVFGDGGFVASIVWQKKYSRDNRPAVGTVHDTVLLYAPKPDVWKQVRNRIVRTGAKEYRNPNNDPKGDWRAVPMTAQGYRPNQMYEIVTPSGVVHTPPKGRCWGMLEERYLALREQGLIYFGKDGSAQPGVIRYLADDEGLVPWTWWPHDEVGHTDEAKKEMLSLFPHEEPFSTPKPERFMRRVIHIGSNPGDIVLDCFAGSGTTAAVSHKMGRRWVTSEILAATVDQFTVPRLSRVVAGEDPGGITKSAGWEGGGGFRAVTVGPSMYEDTPFGVLLAAWATNGRFARAVAGQLGFEFQPDAAPLYGIRGRMRLAVVDGAVGPEEVRQIVGALGEKERVTLVAKSVLPEVESLLAEISPGSRIRKAPRDLLTSGAQRMRRRTDPAPRHTVTSTEGSGA